MGKELQTTNKSLFDFFPHIEDLKADPDGSYTEETIEENGYVHYKTTYISKDGSKRYIRLELKPA